MKFREGLQAELDQEGIDVQVEEEVLDISSTDVVRLNQRIGRMIEDDRIMLESSPGKAARFACSK